MANTPKLNVPEISESQAAKYLTNNDGLRMYDVLVQGTVIDKDLSEPPGGEADGDSYIVGATSSSSSDWNGHDNDIAYYKSSGYIYLTPRSGWLYWVEDEARYYLFLSESDGWVTLESISAERFTDLNDTPADYSGQAYRVARINSGENALEFVENSYDIGAFFNGSPGASQVLLRLPMVRAVRFADDFAGSEAKVGVDPAAQAVFLIKKDGVEFAQMTFAGGATTATFATDSGLEDFAAGDVLTVEAPDSPDADLQSIGFLFKGVKI